MNRIEIMAVRCLVLSAMLISMIVFPHSSFALDLRTLDIPMMIGPQYPIFTGVASFHPDTAFIMPQDKIALQISQVKSNSFEFSQNSVKNDNKNAHPSEFVNDGSDGYSVYIDVELRTTLYQLRMAAKSWLEVQFVKQTAGMASSVALDSFIENFHEVLGMGNYERERAGRGQFDFYVYDNETGEYVIAISDPDPFEQVVDTYSLKLSLFQDESLAIALKSSTAYYYLKTDSDQADFKRQSHDQNHSLLMSVMFDRVTLHSAYSVTYMEDTIFEKSPNDLYFWFLGSNFHVSESWDFITQVLRYRSIYPDHKEGDTSLSDDVVEFAFGARGHWNDFILIDLAIVENYTNSGPSNIDAAFYGNIAIMF